MRKEHKHLVELNDIIKSFREGIESSSLLHHESNLTVEGLQENVREQQGTIESLKKTIEELRSNSILLTQHNALKLEAARTKCESDHTTAELKAMKENYTRLERLTGTLREKLSDREKDTGMMREHQKEQQLLQQALEHANLKLKHATDSKKQLRNSFEEALKQLLAEKDSLVEKIKVLHSTGESYKNRISVEEQKNAAMREKVEKMKCNFEEYSSKPMNDNLMKENQMLQRQVAELKEIYTKHIECTENRKQQLEERIHKMEMDRLDTTVHDSSENHTQKLLNDFYKVLGKFLPECPTKPSPEVLAIELKKSLSAAVNSQEYTLPPSGVDSRIHDAKIKELEGALTSANSKLQLMSRKLARASSTAGMECKGCKAMDVQTVKLEAITSELEQFKQMAKQGNEYQEQYHNSQAVLAELRKENDSLRYKYNSLKRSAANASAYSQPLTNKSEYCGDLTQVLRQTDARTVERDSALKKAEQIRAFFLSEVRTIRQVVGCFLGWDFHIDKTAGETFTVALKCLYSGPSSCNKITFSDVTNRWMKSILGGSPITDSEVPIMELEGDYLDRFEKNKLVSEQSQMDWYAQFMALQCLEDFSGRVMCYPSRVA